MKDAGRGEYRIVALRESRDDEEKLTRVRFSYGGRDFQAEREPGRREWRVQAGAQVVGFIGTPDGASPEEVAQTIVTLYGRGAPS